MPYTPLSCGTGHSFHGTRTIPYTHWGSECQNKTAPALRENATRSCVLDRTGRARESEWKNSREAEGRPKGAVESSGIVQLSMRDRDEEMSRLKRERVWSNIQNGGTNAVSFLTQIDHSDLRNRSDPLCSVMFLATGFRPVFRRTNSDDFPVGTH